MSTSRRTDPRSQAQQLASALRRAIDGQVRFDPGSRHLYSTDASNFRQVPIGVVLPRSVTDVVATVEVCRSFGAPITHRGGGTSLAGQACNAAVIIDHSRHLTGIGAVDADRRSVRAEPGVVLDTLREHTRREHGLTWGPDPSTHNRCTIGGMIGNNACGMHAHRYGLVEDNVAELDILLYDGTRMRVGALTRDQLTDRIAAGGREGGLYTALKALRDDHEQAIRTGFPDVPRRISGFNLPRLLGDERTGPGGMNLAAALVGTEGTCVTVLGATLRLNPEPAAQGLVVLGYPGIAAAADQVPAIRGHDAVLALEGIDGALAERVRATHPTTQLSRFLPEGAAWLLVEVGGESDRVAHDHARELADRLGRTQPAPTSRVYRDPAEEAVVWQARKTALAATARFGETQPAPGWEDSAVHPDVLGDYLRDLQGLFDAHGLTATVYGHFGDGCVHCRIDFDLTSRRGISDYSTFLQEAAELCVDHGGSLSGEHGDGQQRGRLLETMYGPDLVGAFRDFKAIFDPGNRMNPGKVVDAAGPDDHLRLVDADRQWHPETTFAYPDDGFDFNRAQQRCVGIGTCRRDDGAGTMCPSYMVTHDEQHSTRGRARLLFEMLQPDSELDGWRDESIHEALELCLSCKGCKTDCPTGVDMATYKAEFNHHHWAGRLRPRSHYALGLIAAWSRLASRVPQVVNRALRAPVVGGLVRGAAGVAPRRPLPRFAVRTFRDWFQHRPVAPSGGHDRPEVVLFVDTFVNHFEPEVGRATVAVLEDAGYRVRLPPRVVCCGRPLYDYGFLGLARRYLDRVIEALGDDVAAGTPVVGMEPSCVAVLRDELLQLRPGDAQARRLAEATVTLDEFLVDEADYDFPGLGGPALVQGHCHRKAALGLRAQQAALDAIGLDWHEPDAGCCGLAGSFGFEAGRKFEVSVRAGERKLLPAVRAADADTLIVADGFSCRTQIEHLQRLDGNAPTPRRALHLAQVIGLAHEQRGG